MIKCQCGCNSTVYMEENTICIHTDYGTFSVVLDMNSLMKLSNELFESMLSSILKSEKEIKEEIKKEENDGGIILNT